MVGRVVVLIVALIVVGVTLIVSLVVNGVVLAKSVIAGSSVFAVSVSVGSPGATVGGIENLMVADFVPGGGGGVGIGDLGDSPTRMHKHQGLVTTGIGKVAVMGYGTRGENALPAGVSSLMSGISLEKVREGGTLVHRSLGNVRSVCCGLWHRSIWGSWTGGLMVASIRDESIVVEKDD